MPEFNAGIFDLMYKQFLGPLSREILLAFNNGTNFTVYPPRTAWVDGYRDKDIIPGGSIEQGDVRVVMLVDQLPSIYTEMRTKDRIIIDNKYYSIINWDPYTRTIGGQGLAYNIHLRGGGTYIPGVIYNIITEAEELLITEGYMVTE